MLLWTTLLCLLSIDLAVSQAVQPDILLNSGQSTALQPLKDKMQNKDSTDNVHLIRGLLTVRQSGCPTDYAECTNPAGRSVSPLLLSVLFLFPPYFVPTLVRAFSLRSFARHVGNSENFWCGYAQNGNDFTQVLSA